LILKHLTILVLQPSDVVISEYCIPRLDRKINYISSVQHFGSNNTCYQF